VPEEVRSDPRLRRSPFEILPAIDLFEGACVRLRQGRYDSATRYAGDPVRVAQGFEAEGARWIHLVDLDAARRKFDGPASGAQNREAIRQIRRGVACRIEVGGGIRSEEDVRELLGLGVDRLVLGTVLVRNPDAARRWSERFGPVFVAGIDAAGGRVRVAGWETDGGSSDLELARRSRQLGMAGIVYTAIARDGTLDGPDLERTVRVAEVSGLPVIVSGGVGGPADVERAAALDNPLVRAVIIGRAIYEGRVDLGALIRRFTGPGS
jgi:phosphoribosylformimino-5-aminoimidazole carboxamide ribotide isomerase